MQKQIRRRLSLAAKGDKDLLSNITNDLKGEEVSFLYNDC